MKKVIIVFILALFLSGVFGIFKARAEFDCMKLTQSSTDAQKQYCKTELAKIEAELADLIKKQQAQQKSKRN